MKKLHYRFLKTFISLWKLCRADILTMLLVAWILFLFLRSTFTAPFNDIVHFGYNGHQYFKFRDGSDQSIVHDPDCICNKFRLAP